MVFFAADAPAHTIAPLTIGQVLTRVRAAYATASAADFTQTYIAPSYGITRTTSGRVVLANGKTDWEYASPPKTRVVTDAASVCSYDPASGTLVMQPLANSWLGQLLPFFTAPNTTTTFQGPTGQTTLPATCP